MYLVHLIISSVKVIHSRNQIQSMKTAILFPEQDQMLKCSYYEDSDTYEVLELSVADGNRKQVVLECFKVFEFLYLNWKPLD